MDLHSWANISAVFLIIVAFILTLIPGAIVAGLWYGLKKGVTWLKDVGFPETQRYSRLVADETKRYSGMVTTPIAEFDTKVTKVRKTVGAVPRLLRRRQRSQHV